MLPPVVLLHSRCAAFFESLRRSRESAENIRCGPGARQIGRTPRFGLAAAAFSLAAASGTASAKTLIDYFKPTPTVCAASSNTWGASSSLPRDACNGLEDTKKPPQWLYWDGTILRADDGKYHLLGSRWAASLGLNGGWHGSDAIHAVSESSPLGPFVEKGVAYSNGPDSGDRSKGHNVAAARLPDGTYCLFVSEIVPFTIFTSPSLDGTWTNKGHATIDKNGVPISIPAPGDQNLESNVSLVVRPDGNFEIVQRHGIIALSTTGLLGPYKVQKPTTTYAAAEAVPATIPSIYPNRKKHLDAQAPQTPESTYVLAEDPLIWYSGGQYHVVYNYPDDRVAYHLTSPDGIHDWTDRGLAYDPRMAKQLFSTTDGAIVSWTKMERPNIIMESGHITHFTFAVTDVQKEQITGGSNHGTKVLVVAFDGATFDAETGVGAGGVAGSAGASGTTAVAGGGSAGGSVAGTGGSLGGSGAGGYAAVDGRAGSSGAGVSTSAGASSSSGSAGIGSGGVAGATAINTVGGSALGGAAPTAGARAASDGKDSDSCSCTAVGTQQQNPLAPGALLGLALASRIRRRRR